MPGSVNIREYAPGDRQWLEAIAAPGGGTGVVSRGVLHDFTTYPGFVAEKAGHRCGFAFHRVEGDECELVAIEATQQWCGIGTALIAAAEQAVRDAGCRRIWLVTTNDNIDAIRFYQRRGYRLAAVHSGAVDGARRIKPSIPDIGNYGIPMRDEFEFEKYLV